MGLRLMFEPGYMLAKAGVMLCDLSSAVHQQSELDLEDEASGRDRSELMKAMDQLSIGDTKLMFVPLCSEKFHW